MKDSVWQKWLPSAGAYLIIGDKFRPMYVQDMSKAPIIQLEGMQVNKPLLNSHFQDLSGLAKDSPKIGLDRNPWRMGYPVIFPNVS